MHIVTGGAGFIGSAFIARLNLAGVEDILVVDELGHGEKWKNLQGLKFSDYLHKDQFMEKVLSNRLPDKVRAIIHLGACSSTTETDAEYVIQNNYRYTRSLADWVLPRERVRFIYASSAATYGGGEQGFSDDEESLSKLRPLNVYGFSKHLFDLWALKTGASKKIAGVKFFNVFGPNEYHKEDMLSVVFKAYSQIKESGRVQLFKSYRKDYQDGEQKRDFIYIKDCNEILWWLLEHPQSNGIFNLGTAQARSWNDLAKAVFTALKMPVNIDYIEMPESIKAKYQYFTEAKMDKLRGHGCNLSFRSLEEAVADYVAAYLVLDKRHLSADTYCT